MPRFVLALLVAAPGLLAQAPVLVLPDASPRALASQQVGLTDIDIAYHRPAVKGRKVWGGIVPYDQVWRAGANENTVITFSTPVAVGGTVLPAGRYGLHMLPTSTDWTVMFSSQSNAWGSYTYDPREDVARVKVAPRPVEHTERLAYTFDDPAENAVTLSLRWEKLRVPVRIDIDTRQVVVRSLRDQLRGLQQFFPEGWVVAAAWCLRNEVNLDEAEKWIDRSLSLRESFTGLRTKAALLEKKGAANAAETLRAKALAMAGEAEINQLGYTLLGQNKVDEAIALFQRNVKEHPGSWNVHDSLAEACAIKGDKGQAIANYRRALDLVKQEEQRSRIKDELAKLEK